MTDAANDPTPWAFACDIYSPAHFFTYSHTIETPMADPAPDDPSIDLNDIEKVLDDLLQQDPAKVQRLHDFFSKLQAAMPVIKLVLKMVSLIK